MVRSVFFLFFLQETQAQTEKPVKIFRELSFSFLEGCETGKGHCAPVAIVRYQRSDYILLGFPSGGTQSDVYLTALDSSIAKLHGRKYGGQKARLDLTGLNDGDYFVNMYSCVLGGGCIVKLITLHK